MTKERLVMEKEELKQAGERLMYDKGMVKDGKGGIETGGGTPWV